MTTLKRKYLKDLYLKYPFKCREILGTTVPLPYFPKQEIDCDSPHSLTYKEWKTILDSYFDTTLDYLSEGYTYKIPHYLGTVKLVKIKGGGKNWNECKEGKVTYNNVAFNNRRFAVRWYRGVFPFKWMWRLKLTKSAWLKVQNKYLNNFSKFNNLSDA